MRAALPCALALAGCVAVEAPPRLGGGVPLAADEARVWQTAAEVERNLAESGRLHGDRDLETYLLEVARRLQRPEVLAVTPLRVRVVADTRPNAFALPNGAIYVHAGFLARMRSEAELAAVLAHETVHVTHRHSLRKLRRARDWTSGAAGLVRVAAVTGYGRELEREADRVGIARMQAAGYDASAALRVLERLREWNVAEGTKEEPTFYASHPRLAERLETCRELVPAAQPPARADAGAREAEGFARRIASVLLGNGRVELAAGRYRAAWDQAQRYLALAPDDAAAHLLLGEIARRDDGVAAPGAAAASYRRALELDPRAAEAWRGLALVLAKGGDPAGARAAFTRYLELAPDAADRLHVEAALKRLGGTP